MRQGHAHGGPREKYGNDLESKKPTDLRINHDRGEAVELRFLADVIEARSCELRSASLWGRRRISEMNSVVKGCPKHSKALEREGLFVILLFSNDG
jgi:hypothetical protein